MGPVDYKEYMDKTRNTLLCTTNQGLSSVKDNSTLNKRVLDFFVKSVEAYDLLIGQTHEWGGIVQDIKSAIVLFELCAKNLIFWINPFSKETIDQDLLVQSLKISLGTSTFFKVGHDYTKVAQSMVDQLMEQKSYSSRGEVLTSLKEIVEGYHYKPEQVDNIMQGVVVQQRARSKRVILMMTCFTLVCVGGGWTTLKQRGVFDSPSFSTLLGVASRIGNHVPLLQKCMEMTMNCAVDQVLRTFATIGLTLALVEAKCLVCNTYKRNQKAQSEEEKEQTKKEFKTACYDAANTAVDLVCVAVPLLVEIGPKTADFLGVLSKGTGPLSLLCNKGHLETVYGFISSLL
jgi:hypothetical protein